MNFNSKSPQVDKFYSNYTYPLKKILSKSISISAILFGIYVEKITKITRYNY